MHVDKYESISELMVRFILLIYYMYVLLFSFTIRTSLFSITSYMKPRIREIHDEEWWLYMNPTGTNYIPFRVLIVRKISFFIIFVNIMS